MAKCMCTCVGNLLDKYPKKIQRLAISLIL